MSHSSSLPVPFKVMSSFPVGLTHGYKILLVDLKGFTSNTKLEWYEEAIMKLILRSNCEKKTLERVILARKIRPHFFLPGDISPVMYESRNSSIVPRFIEFNYASLNNPKFCRRGFVMLTSSDECPLMTSCPHYKPQGPSCKHLVHYKEVTYSELFEIEPSIRVEGDYDVVRTLLCLFYKDVPLVKVNEIHIHTPLMYVDKVTIKNRLWPTTSHFVLEPKYKIGWTIKAVKGLLFTYYKEALQSVVEKVVLDDRARKTLEYNYYLSKKQARTPVYSSITHRVVKDLKEFDYCPSFRKYRDMTLGSDFVNYCEHIIAHLITHLFINYICKTIPICLERVYHDIRATSNTIEAIVTSDDPLMYQVIEFLEERPIRTLSDLINRAHELVRGEGLKELDFETEVSERSNAEIIKTITNFVDTTGYLPHPYILWTYINLKVRKGKASENEVDRLVSLLANSLASNGFSLVQVKNCHYDFVSQWAFFNPTLLPPLLSELRLALNSSEITLLKDRGSSNLHLINSLLSLANKQVYVVTGHLSSIIIERLIKSHVQRGVNANLLAGMVFKSKDYKVVVEETTNKGLRVKTLSKRLPKYTLMIIDDAVALIGYWNLTNTSLKSTETYSLILCGPQKVKALTHYLKLQALDGFVLFNNEKRTMGPGGFEPPTTRSPTDSTWL